ncbi:unnamed protein product [Orchesella dallaii]|uniref:Histone-lysine N-methyltransferase PRDM9 n=1 Tax=Orchesella dallaii TaxID=48710 RepID=A0ABP1S321_9HEXA
MDDSMACSLTKYFKEFKEKKTSSFNFSRGYLITRDVSMLEHVDCDCVGDCRPTSCTNALGFMQCSEKCNCSNRFTVDSEKYLEAFIPGPEELGIGVRATREIRKGKIVGEYVGKLRSNDEFQERMKTKYANDKHFYGMKIQQKESNNGITIPELVLDARKRANRTRWINHCSVRPNLKVEFWRKDGLPRVYFRALYNLPKGTELTYDYGMDDWNPEDCLCSNCSPNGNATPFVPKPEKRKRVASPEKRTRKSARIEGQQPIPPVSVEVQTDAISESEPENNENVASVTTKTFVCEICSKTFTSKSNIRRHKLVHVPENRQILKCVACTVTFTDKNGLKRHLKSVHSDQPELFEKMEKEASKRKIHGCDLCSKRFTHKKALIFHQSSKHQ